MGAAADFQCAQVHLILRHKSPKGVIEEKHLKSPPLVLLDKKTHVYTAIIKPDNTCVQQPYAGSSHHDGSCSNQTAALALAANPEPQLMTEMWLQLCCVD